MSARELAPRPPGEAVSLPDAAPMTRKTKVAVACELCRIRRVKVGVPFHYLHDLQHFGRGN
jgi:hypothetical protein